MPTASSPARTRLQLSLLGILFLAPFFSAYIAVFLFDWRPAGGGALNYGQLVHPARPVPEILFHDPAGRPVAGQPLRDKWTLVQRVQGGCADACLRDLVLSRQTRTSLNEKRERVRRVLIADAATDLAGLQAGLAAEHPDLVWLRDSASGQAQAFFAEAPANALLLIDPNGNWLMWYPPVAADQASVQKHFKGMQKDITKLLRLSSMG